MQIVQKYNKYFGFFNSLELNIKELPRRIYFGKDPLVSIYNVNRYQQYFAVLKIAV